MQTVFVYGTLRQTHQNEWMMRYAEGQYTGDDSIAARRVVVAHSLPGIVPDENNTVYGELYDISDAGLVQLDRFEGHPMLYERREVTTHGGVKAWAYFPEEHYISGEA